MRALADERGVGDSGEGEGLLCWAAAGGSPWGVLGGRGDLARGSFEGEVSAGGGGARGGGGDAWSRGRCLLRVLCLQG